VYFRHVSDKIYLKNLKQHFDWGGRAPWAHPLATPLVVLYPDEGLLSCKPKRWCWNLILFKHVEMDIKWLHQN